MLLENVTQDILASYSTGVRANEKNNNRILYLLTNYKVFHITGTVEQPYSPTSQQHLYGGSVTLKRPYHAFHRQGCSLEGRS